MQRKALKQLGKVTQWTSEKVFSGEKTQLSSEFTDFEKEIDVRRIGIERLHATSLPFFNQLTKAKPTADPYPPPGSGKDKISYTEALGLVMIDYGDELGGEYGDGLSKYGRARCRLAAAQEDFSQRLGDNYIAGMEAALAAVNEYKGLRKKLDSRRRLALDAAISKAQSSKKDQYALEEEVHVAKQRFEEIEEETQQRMFAIQETEERQFAELADLLEAELEYHGKCREILDDLKNSWGNSGSRSTTTTRTRSNTATSSRSLGRTAVTRSHSSRHGIAPDSEEEEENVGGRSRSHSNASSSGKVKEKRSMLPSFGSFGKKSGLSASASAPKKKSYGREKFGDSRTALHSEEDNDDDQDDDYGAGSAYGSNRARSHSQLSTSNSSLRTDNHVPPPSMRRALTSPPNPAARYADPSARYVKALFDYAGNAADELQLRVGQVIKVETEVSEDWWMGECDGERGIFPQAYTEEYIPSPQAAVPPPMPARNTRNMPPPVSSSVVQQQPRTMPPPPSASSRQPVLPPSPTMNYNDSEFDSELESDAHGFSDADHNFTASLAGDARPVAVNRERSSTISKRAAPPPPPSRRSQSSNNLLSAVSMGPSSSSHSSASLSPPQTIFGRARSSTTTTLRQVPMATTEASPFGHSDDDQDDHDHDRDNGGYSSPSGGDSGLSHGLGAMHLQGSGGAGASQTASTTCGQCGCRDFTQNVFKSKGTCSTCFHAH
ncbi:hypothetical protein I316_04930 [Kwoniella heveanensis BCC8398]|uniref:BAR-domain-containing protein n=1 Tax=Kwoniella heveanensis BCC8398 TaxID=1296120 RepID=A0A1B9GR07_9TREE|nr:hypothetical protein I316_04930 [Kwoniella heveanensis BCC8398]